MPPFLRDVSRQSNSDFQPELYRRSDISSLFNGLIRIVGI